MVVIIVTNSKDIIPPQTRLKTGDIEHGPALPSLQSISFTSLRNPRTLTRSTGNPERMKYPRWRTMIWRKEIQSDARASRLRSKLKFIKIICVNKIWHRWVHAQSFLIILFWQLSDPASQCVQSGVPFRFVLVAEWGSWVGSRFSAPTVKSGDFSPF